MLFRPFIERHFLGSFKPFPCFAMISDEPFCFPCLVPWRVSGGYQRLGLHQPDRLLAWFFTQPTRSGFNAYRHHNQLCDQDDQTHHHHRAGYGVDNQDKMSIITRMTINLLVSNVSWSFERPAKKKRLSIASGEVSWVSQGFVLANDATLQPGFSMDFYNSLRSSCIQNRVSHSTT